MNTLCNKTNSSIANNNRINDEKSFVSFKLKEDIYENKRHYFIKPKDSTNKF